jgi:hypothetical protein
MTEEEEFLIEKSPVNSPFSKNKSATDLISAVIGIKPEIKDHEQKI